MEPDSASRYVERALFYANNRDFEAAVADMGRAIQLDPDSHGYYTVRAEFYAVLGQADLAYEDLHTVLGLPGSTPAKANVQQLFDELGESGVREMLDQQASQPVAGQS